MAPHTQGLPTQSPELNRIVLKTLVNGIKKIPHLQIRKKPVHFQVLHLHLNVQQKTVTLQIFF